MSSNFGINPPTDPDANPGTVNADGYTVGAGQTVVVSATGAVSATTVSSEGAVSGTSFKPGTYTVAQLAALSPQPVAGSIVYCSNGDTGSACLAVRVGTSWLRIALGAAVSAT